MNKNRKLDFSNFEKRIDIICIDNGKNLEQSEF